MGTITDSDKSVVVGVDSPRKWRKLLYSKVFLAVVVAVVVLTGMTSWVIISYEKKQTPVAENSVVRLYAQKLTTLKNTAASHPNSAAAHVSYAEALYVTGNKTTAQAEYIRAGQLDPHNATIWNNLGNTYRDLGKYTQAVSAYRRAIQLAPSDQNAYINLANVQIFSLQSPADAITTYKTAMNKIGTTASLQLLLSLAYEQNKQIDQALQTYKSILSTDPSNQAAKDNINRLTK